MGTLLDYLPKYPSKGPLSSGPLYPLTEVVNSNKNKLGTRVSTRERTNIVYTHSIKACCGGTNLNVCVFGKFWCNWKSKQEATASGTNKHMFSQ